MNVGLALEIDSSIDHMAAIVTELDDVIRQCFRDVSYGSGVKNLTIGVILTSPDVGHLHPVRELRYRKHVRYKTPKMEFHDVVEYDVRPESAIFAQLGLEQARAYLARVLIESTELIERHKEKFPDFDVARFRQDFEGCLRGQC
jgi:hypothetical protein